MVKAEVFIEGSKAWVRVHSSDAEPPKLAVRHEWEGDVLCYEVPLSRGLALMPTTWEPRGPPDVTITELEIACDVSLKPVASGYLLYYNAWGDKRRVVYDTRPGRSYGIAVLADAGDSVYASSRLVVYGKEEPEWVGLAEDMLKVAEAAIGASELKAYVVLSDELSIYAPPLIVYRGTEALDPAFMVVQGAVEAYICGALDVQARGAGLRVADLAAAIVKGENAVGLEMTAHIVREALRKRDVKLLLQAGLGRPLEPWSTRLL